MARAIGAGAVSEPLENRLLLSSYAYALNASPFVWAVTGSSPFGPVVADTSGDLYGTAGLGGANAQGTVFKVAPGTTTLQTLVSFNGRNGSEPMGTLAMDPGGNLYGTTQAGGSSGLGTVFEIPAGTSTIQTLATFNGKNGANPLTGLTFDSAGNLYGTTFHGGDGGVGTVFTIPRGTGAIQTLASFSRTALMSHSGVAVDADGNLFGTITGGTAANGAVFEIPAGTNTIRTLVEFNRTNGSNPIGGVTIDANGNLFGATLNGGANDLGTVYTVPHGTNSIQTIASFNNNVGIEPEATVTLDADGNIFGTTFFGGASGKGTLFEIAHGTGIIQTLASFNGTNGASPSAAVTIDPAGNICGTTPRGGINDGGTVFVATPVGFTPPAFLGHALNINSETIEAENFNNGGEGVGYHDTTPGNQNRQYRPSGDVDINKGGSNGYSVGYTAPGEWLNYAITAPAGGTYVLQARVANFKQGGTFHIEIDGKNVTGTMTVPDTGPWDTWQTITSQAFNVAAGNHTMRVVMDSGGYWGNVGDFDSFRFVERMPFGGTPINIATDAVEAENFDNGGEGVAYHDTTFQNVNGQYRPTEAVDINKGGSNRFSVGYTAPGEWLNYTISSPGGGTYRLVATVANDQQGGTFHVEIDGVNVTGPMTVPHTGPWDTWQVLTSQSFTVTSGVHQMRVLMDAPGYWGNIADFDSFRFAPAAAFHGAPFIAGSDRIEAEDFDLGGEGNAYHDTTPGNHNGQYRPTENVDINKGGSNGYSVGYTAPGEWLNYTINAPTSRNYRLLAQVANYQQGGTFHVEIDGKNVTGTMTVPNTGPWDTWQSLISQPFTVSAGNHVMRVVMDKGGYWGNIGDFDYFQFLPTGAVTLVSQQRSVTVYSMTQTSEVTQTVQAGPADFSPFDRGLQSTDYYFPTGTAMASQSSSLTVTDTSAQFSATGIAAKGNNASATGGQTLFQVVFDVYSPTAYTLTFSQGHDFRHQRATATLAGPGGVLNIDPIEFQTPGYVSTGTLQAGRYTLSTGAFGGQQFDLQMKLGNA